MLPRSVVIVDLEFGDVSITDPQGKVAPIVEIGALSVTAEGEVLNRFERQVKPYEEFYSAVTPKILNLTGLTHPEIQAADAWHHVFTEFKEFCGNSPLASWAYDDTYLMRRWCGYVGIPYTLNYEFYELRTLFAVEFAKKYPGERIPVGLSAVCKRLHITRPEHRALADCQTVLQIFEMMYDVRVDAPTHEEDDEPFQLFEF